MEKMEWMGVCEEDKMSVVLGGISSENDIGLKAIRGLCRSPRQLEISFRPFIALAEITLCVYY